MAARSRSTSLRVATANSLKDPALDLEPRLYAVGSRVRVSFDRHLYAGVITASHQRIFTVEFDDGEVWEDVKESEKSVRPAVEAVLEEKRLIGYELRAYVKRLAEEEAKIRAQEDAERMEVIPQKHKS